MDEENVGEKIHVWKNEDEINKLYFFWMKCWLKNIKKKCWMKFFCKKNVKWKYV